MITVDRNTIIQILGGLMSKPELLSNIDKYQLEPFDFPTQLDKFVFSAIYNLYAGGAEKIHTNDIDNYLKDNLVAKEIIDKNNGLQFLQDCEAYADVSNFSYYYNKLKKINLIKELEKNGQDMHNFYCDNPLDENYDKINTRFEQLKSIDILNSIKGTIADIEKKYIINNVVEESKAYTGIRDLIAEYKKKPEIGVRLQGDIFNTISRGGRKGKLYLRSAGSGIGKTRSMVGDACNIAYPIRFEPKYNKWIATGTPEKVLYIMTEQDPAEIQTMILAYLTGYNEEIFLYGTYDDRHMERIMKALDIMEKYQNNMLFARIPDPCASVIQNLFRRYAFQEGVENFFYDYIFSSPAMLNEYRDLGLREDVCLRLLTTALKNLAVELNAFIMSATQLSNDDDPKGGFKDFRNIRGSRAIVDLADFACIRRRPSPDELNLVSGFEKRYNYTPNMITDIFKNRRGRWTMLSIWSAIDLGTLRTIDLFVTTPDYKPIDEFQIIDFIDITDEQLKELENFYNDGIVSDELAEELLNSLQNSGLEEKMIDSITEAFGNAQETKERLKNMSLGDLI